MDLIIQLIIIMIICGFVYWIWTLIRPLLPLPDPFGRVVDILVIILIVFIILFYALIPILRMLPRILH